MDKVKEAKEEWDKKMKYNKARELLNELYDKYEMGQFPDDEKRQESAAKDFLGQARKVGIRYVKAKE